MTVPSHANYAPNNIGRRIRTNSRLFLPDGVSAKIQRSALFSGGGGLSFRQLVDDLVQIWCAFLLPASFPSERTDAAAAGESLATPSAPPPPNTPSPAREVGQNLPEPAHSPAKRALISERGIHTVLSYGPRLFSFAFSLVSTVNTACPCSGSDLQRRIRRLPEHNIWDQDRRRAERRRRNRERKGPRPQGHAAIGRCFFAPRPGDDRRICRRLPS